MEDNSRRPARARLSAPQPVRFPVRVNPEQWERPPAKLDAPENVELVFGLVPLRGRGWQAVLDATFAAGAAAGRIGHVQSGAIVRARVSHGVAYIEGLEDEQGRPLAVMTDQVFDLLPSWLVARLGAEIQALTPELGEEATKN